VKSWKGALRTERGRQVFQVQQSERPFTCGYWADWSRDELRMERKGRALARGSAIQRKQVAVPSPSPAAGFPR
jgi:hypothetical protein